VPPCSDGPMANGALEFQMVGELSSSRLGCENDAEAYVSRYPQTDAIPLNHCAGAPLIHLVLLVMNARATVSEVLVFVEMPVWTVASCGMAVAGVIRLDHKAPLSANLWATCCMVLVIRYLTSQ
jgi:hypothetical protein